MLNKGRASLPFIFLIKKKNMTLDFSILESSSKNFIFVDDSTYNEFRPDSPILAVNFPSISKAYEMAIRPGEINIVNTKSLCYSSENIVFPDGLYMLSYSVEPNDKSFIKKNYMRFTKAKEKLADLLLNKDISQETINKYYKLDIMMQASETMVNTNESDAMDLFNMIQKEIIKLSC